MATEAAADDATLEEELEELEDDEVLGEDDEPDHDDQVPGEEDLEAAEEQKPEAGEDLRRKVAELEERNHQISGWAGRMRHENQALQDRLTKGEERMERLPRAMAEAQGVDVAELDRDPSEKVPDPDEDFAGHLVARVRQEVAGLRSELLENQQKEAGERQVEKVIANVHSTLEADAQRFEAEHPDYNDAEAFVLEDIAEAEERAIRNKHPRAPQAWVDGQVRAALLDTVSRHQLAAYKEGWSLAEYTYSEALRRGYQANGNGEAPAARKRSGPPNPLKKRRQAAGTSIAAASGVAGTGGKRLEQLLELSDDDFEKAIEGKDFRKLAAQIEAGGP